VQFLNTGSEATYQAIRLARAVTGRDHIVVMQGGYNGWHDDVSCNLMTPLDVIGPGFLPVNTLIFRLVRESRARINNLFTLLTSTILSP